MEYQAGNRINLEQCRITDRVVQVCSSSTSYCNQYYVDAIDPDDVLDTYKQLVKSAKMHGVKIVYKRGESSTKKQILALRSPYLEQRNVYEKRFSDLRTGFDRKVKKGIYAPTCDDHELKDLMRLRNDIIAMFYRCEPMSKLSEINARISECLENISEIYSITL